MRFCNNCGTENSDDFKFCIECGEKSTNIIEKAQIEDDEILTIYPTFKFGYKFTTILLFPFLPPMVLCPFLALLLICILVSGSEIILKWINFLFTGDAFESISVEMPIVVLTAIVIYFCIAFLLTGISKYSIFRKKYIFYGDRVVYKDSFWGAKEKEIKYENIREIRYCQKIFEKKFDLGTIIFYTTANTGSNYGLNICDLDNGYESYQKIKEIVKL